MAAEWCGKCTRHHDDVEAHHATTDALAEILTEVERNEADQRLNDRIDWQTRSGRFRPEGGNG